MGYIENIRKKVGHDPIFMPAAGGIFVKDDHILLQRRTDNGLWGIHGGALELGETAFEALCREVKEELNLKILDAKLIRVYSGKPFYLKYPNQDEVYIIDHVFEVTTYQGQMKLDEKEVSEVKWFSFDNIPWSTLMGHQSIILKDYIEKRLKKRKKGS